jgi:molybdopterin-guanine dinucleotide biosynthesis protein A
MEADSDIRYVADRDVLGVVLAGGGSRRFGTDKALYPLLDRPMAAWTLAALAPWTSRQVVITPDRRVAEALGVPGRADLIPGLGPLGGLHTALSWAREDGRTSVFLLACDLPLVGGDLIGRILGSWPAGVRAVVPGSHGPLGFEPLCAGYEVSGLPELESLIESGRRSMESALELMGAYHVPPASLGDPEELALAFTNVNTVDTARWVEGALSDTISSAGNVRPQSGEQRQDPEGLSPASESPR